MSVAAKWKLREKETAAAAAAAKTDDSGFRGRKVDTPARETSSVADSLGKGSEEKPTKLDTSRLAPNTAGNAVGKQGCYKLPVGKGDAAKTPPAKEPNGVQGKDSRSQLINSGPSKTPNGGKDATPNYGGRRAFGADLRKEEPTVTTKAKTDVRVIESKTKIDKDAATDGRDDKDSPFGSGRTKGLAGFWANQTDEVKSVKKKRLTAIEDNLDATIVENSPPQQKEGVTRAEDPGEWKKPIQLQEGWTKNVANSLQTQRQNSFAKKTPICLIEDTIDEKTDSQDATKATIRVKDISQRLVGQQIEPQKPKEKVVIDLSQGSIVLAENQPDEVDPDVVRSESASEEVVLEKGRTRNLLQHWKNTEVEYNAPKTSTTRYQGSKPAWILEIEAAKGNSGNKTEDNIDKEEKESTAAKDEEICKTEPRPENIGETSEQRKTENPISKPTATQNSDRDRIKTPNAEDSGEKELSSSAVETSDGRPHVPKLSGKPESDKEHIVTDEAEPISTVAETQRTAMPVDETSLVCHETSPILTSDTKQRVEPDNDRIIDTKSVSEDVPAVISSNEPDISVGPSPEVLEDSFGEKDAREGANISNEKPIFECESRDPFAVIEEDTANRHIHTTHLDQNVTELPIAADSAQVDNADQSIGARISDETTVDELQSKVEEVASPVTQLAVVKEDQIECYIDNNFSLNPDQNANENLSQTDVGRSDLNEFEQNKAIVADGERVIDEPSSEQRSEVLKISTDMPTPDDLVPEPDAFSTPTSDFNLLTFDSPLDSLPNTLEQSDETKTNIFSTFDDILKTDYSSFLLDENVDTTPCLLPSGPAEVPQSTENRENSSYRQESSLENDASIGPKIDKTPESFVSEASDDKRAGKREEEKLAKTENSERSCSVM